MRLSSMQYFQKSFMDKGGEAMAAVAVLALLVIWGMDKGKKRK